MQWKLLGKLENFLKVRLFQAFKRRLSQNEYSSPKRLTDFLSSSLEYSSTSSPKR